jgi:hypothetical protein
MKTYPFTVALLSISSCFALVAATVVGCGSSNGSSPSRDTEAGVTADSSTGVVDSGGATKDSGASPEKDAAPDSGAPWAPMCTTSDAGAPAGYPAPHMPFPQVAYGGGGLLVQPEIVTVTFPGDSLQSQLENFDDDIGNTCWWNDVTAGFCETGGKTCIGPAKVPAKAHVEVTAAPAASYTDSSGNGASTLKTFIQQQVASGTFPPPDPGTLYVMYFPASTTVNLDGAVSCTTFGGYHSATSVTPPGGSATQVAYAVLPRCGLGNGLFPTQLDELTFAASHEIIESATDPFNGAGFYLQQSGQANNANPFDYIAWNFFPTGGEVGDLCVDLLGEEFGMPSDNVTAVGQHGQYMVQRMYSSAPGAIGAPDVDPCTPLAFQPYYNLAPAVGHGWSQIPAGDAGTPVGGSVTFEADAFSMGPTNGPWAIGGYDLNSYLNGGQTPAVLTVSFTSGDAGAGVTAVQNGDKINVTVTVTAPLPVISNSGGTTIHGAGFLLVSVDSATKTRHAWPGFITQEKLTP